MLDIPSDRSTTAALAVGWSVDSQIDVDGDTDLFRVDLVAGQSYSFDLFGVAGGGFTLNDPLLVLLDANLSVLAFDDDSGLDLDARLDYTATTSGTYYVRALAYEGIGTYRLSMNLAAAPRDDYGHTAATAGALAFDAPLAGTIDTYGDHDWFRVDLVSGVTYGFALQGADSGHGTLADPRLALYDGAGDLLDVNDDAGDGTMNSFISFTPTSSGRYYLDAGAFGDGTGSYRIVATGGATDLSAGNDTTALLTMGGTLANVIDAPGDEDAVRIHLDAGIRYLFDMHGAAAGTGLSLAGPTFALLDGAMNPIAVGGGAGADAQIGITAATSGTYYLRAFSADGGTGSYQLTMRSADDILTGTAGNDVLNGGTGNDIFFASGGDDLLIGGADNDTVIYAGMARTYARAMTGDSGTIAGGPEGGTDTLSSIETLHFADGYQTSDQTSHAAQVARLYYLVLDRDPDSMGLNFWVHSLEHGNSLAAVADAFAGSPEFLAKTSGLTDADFVEFLYNGALGRGSDPAGKASWVDALDGGALSRGQVIVGFSESVENLGLTESRTDHGFFIYDETYAAIASLYDAFADRLPDQDGLRGWLDQVDHGMSLDTVAAHFADSPEFQQKITGLDERGIVEQLYRNVLGREGDAQGIDGWTHKLQADHDVGALLYDFSRSVEHQVQLQPVLADGIMFL